MKIAPKIEAAIDKQIKGAYLAIIYKVKYIMYFLCSFFIPACQCAREIYPYFPKQVFSNKAFSSKT